MRGTWTPDGQRRDTARYQIPYRSLVSPKKCANVLVGGRAISVDRAAHGATRVMVNRMQTGQAAGAAAAAVTRDAGDVRTLDTRALQDRLSIADGRT